MKKLPTGSVIVGELPKGCELCQRGMKLVLFITGLCPRRCFYCPLGRDRRYLDVMYANERKIEVVEEALNEAHLMDAQGTGITGGDPLLVLNRTLKAIKVLKQEFGEEHHIHLYTTGAKVTVKHLKQLEQVGLDELRFHVFSEQLDIVSQAVKELNIDVGVEIPMLPDKLEATIRLLRSLDAIKVSFVNINELEFTETNALNLLERGYELRANSLVAAKGSREAAIKVLTWAEENTSLNVHFCPAIIKDAYQTRLRLYRKALNLAKHYELVTDEGTIMLAEATTKDMRAIKNIIKTLGNNGLFEVNWDEGKILFRAEYASLISEKFKENVNVSICEYLPTPTRFLVYKEII